jgi:plasmid stabilization system protein ParE
MPHLVVGDAPRRKIGEVWRFYAQSDTKVASRAVSAIMDSFGKLLMNPNIGRPFSGDLYLRELVIPFGATGFIALYRVEEHGNIVILALRHQRERGFRELDFNAT